MDEFIVLADENGTEWFWGFLHHFENTFGGLGQFPTPKEGIEFVANRFQSTVKYEKEAR
jgi:hypothetical protein